MVTSGFLHYGIFHVAVNMYALWIIGAPQERMFGHVRFGLIYLLGGLTGSVLMPVKPCHAIGRSGASPNPKSPPFRDLSRRYPLSNLEEALGEGIVVGHEGLAPARWRSCQD